MKIWETILLFGLGLGMTLAISSVLQVPGYMDAEYYYAGGIELSSGKGFFEPFLWNYLDDPAGLPHPAATYWMPLASLVSALGIFITGKSDYFSTRSFFFIFAGLVPVLTAWLAFKLTHRKVTAWTAGGLAVFSGFYAVYLGLTETFSLYMLLGSVFLVVLVSGIKKIWKACLLGLLAGLLHLARADGLLWLAIGGIYLLFEGRIYHRPIQMKMLAGSLAVFMAVYLSVMGFWYIRNLQVFGMLFPPGTNRAMWLVDYDQLYNFPATTFNLPKLVGRRTASPIKSPLGCIAGKPADPARGAGRHFFTPFDPGRRLAVKTGPCDLGRPGCLDDHFPGDDGHFPTGGSAGWFPAFGSSLSTPVLDVRRGGAGRICRARYEMAAKLEISAGNDWIWTPVRVDGRPGHPGIDRDTHPSRR